MQGYHTQLDNVCIAHLRLFSKRTRISTNTRTIFTFCIPKLQTSDSIYIIKHEHEHRKLIMYIHCCWCAQLLHWGEISLQSPGSERPLMFMGLFNAHVRIGISMDKHFGATESKTVPSAWEGRWSPQANGCQNTQREVTRRHERTHDSQVRRDQPQLGLPSGHSDLAVGF